MHGRTIHSPRTFQYPGKTSKNDPVGSYRTKTTPVLRTEVTILSLSPFGSSHALLILYIHSLSLLHHIKFQKKKSQPIKPKLRKHHKTGSIKHLSKMVDQLSSFMTPAPRSFSVSSCCSPPLLKRRRTNTEYSYNTIKEELSFPSLDSSSSSSSLSSIPTSLCLPPLNMNTPRRTPVSSSDVPPLPTFVLKPRTEQRYGNGFESLLKQKKRKTLSRTDSYDENEPEFVFEPMEPKGLNFDDEDALVITKRQRRTSWSSLNVEPPSELGRRHVQQQRRLSSARCA